MFVLVPDVVLVPDQVLIPILVPAPANQTVSAREREVAQPVRIATPPRQPPACAAPPDWRDASKRDNKTIRERLFSQFESIFVRSRPAAASTQVEAADRLGHRADHNAQAITARCSDGVSTSLPVTLPTQL